MTIATARTRLKDRLDIASAVTTFDTLLDGCLEDAMPRLAPFFVYDMPEDTSVTLLTDADSFTLPSTVSTLHKMYVRTNVNDNWREFDAWTQHGSKIYLYEGIGTTTYVKVLARRPYTFIDGDLALMPPTANVPLLMFAAAEFAVTLVGNKRKFNIYQQSNGARSLDEMRQLAEWYEGRAVRLAEDAISGEG